MHYLIPVDAQPHSQRSIELAQKIFAIAGHEVTLLHVIPPPEPSELLSDTTGTMEETYMEEAAARTQTLLEGIAKPLEQAGAKVNIEILPGFPAATIKTIQAAESVPITILSPAQHTAAELMVEGSMTQQLLRFDYTGTLVRSRELTKEAKELSAVFLFDKNEDLRTIEKMVGILNPSMKILAVSPDPSAMFVIPPPGGQTSTAVAAEVKPEQLLKQAAEEFKKFGRECEQMVLQTRFKDWLTAYMRNSDIGMLVIAREMNAQETRSAFGTPHEEIFLKAPCPTALVNS
jgi:nucleotide-binding universal stress UspA family protein